MSAPQLGKGNDDEMHRLEPSPTLEREFKRGAGISLIFVILILDSVIAWACLGAIGKEWSVAITVSAIVWSATYWPTYGFKSRGERDDREYLRDLLTEVSRAMVGAFSGGSTERDHWVQEYGLAGALQHVLEEGKALHVASATHSGGPNAALGRWRSIRNTLRHARQSLHPFLDPGQRHDLARFIFFIERTISQVQVAKDRPERDLPGFQGEVQNELEAVSKVFHQLVVQWLRLWGQTVPSREEMANIGPSALEKTKPLLNDVDTTYYYLWRDHAYDIDLEEET